MKLDSFIKAGLIINPITTIQKQFLNDSKHRFFIIPAGRRSRKSLIGKYKVLMYAVENEGRYFLAAPTRDQAKRIFWGKLKKAVSLLNANSGNPNETELKIKIINGSEIHVIGLDKPQRVEGTQWHGGHITEFSSIKRGAWAENIRPLFSDTNGFCILDGVPDYREKNFDEYRNLAEYACNGEIPETPAYEGIFRENNEWCYYSWLSQDV